MPRASKKLPLSRNKLLATEMSTEAILDKLSYVEDVKIAVEKEKSTMRSSRWLVCKTVNRLTENLSSFIVDLVRQRYKWDILHRRNITESCISRGKRGRQKLLPKIESLMIAKLTHFILFEKSVISQKTITMSVKREVKANVRIWDYREKIRRIPMGTCLTCVFSIRVHRNIYLRQA